MVVESDGGELLFQEGVGKHGHDILCSGAEVSRPYPACISATSNHTTRKKG